MHGISNQHRLWYQRTYPFVSTLYYQSNNDIWDLCPESFNSVNTILNHIDTRVILQWIQLELETKCYEISSLLVSQEDDFILALITI